MPVGGKQRRAALAWSKGLYDTATITNATLSAGQDDGVTLSAGQTGELAKAQVGQDGELTEYEAVVVGQFPYQGGQTTKGKPTVNIQNSTPADVPAGTMWQYAGRRPGTREGRSIGGWHNEDDYSDVAKSDREAIEPVTPFILEDQYVTVWARNDSSSFTPSFSNSTYNLKVMAWDGQGL